MQCWLRVLETSDPFSSSANKCDRQISAGPTLSIHYGQGASQDNYDYTHYLYHAHAEDHRMGV